VLMGKPYGISLPDELVKELDEELLDAKQREQQGLEPRDGVLYGKFANRSQVIQYAVRYTIDIAQHERDTLEFVIELIRALEENPELGATLRFFLTHIK